MASSHDRKEGLAYRPCVGLMLLNADGLIFAGRRRDRGRMADAQAESAWQMPQGGVDPGETEEVAALRELGEETGLRPEHVRLIRRAAQERAYDLPDHLIGKLWGGRYRGQTQSWFAYRLVAPDDAIDIDTEEPEFDAWRWMTADAIAASIVPFKQAVYASVFEEFADLIGRPAAADGG